MLIFTSLVASLEGFKEVSSQDMLNRSPTALNKRRDFSLRRFYFVECKYLSDVNIGKVLSTVSDLWRVCHGVGIRG